MPERFDRVIVIGLDGLDPQITGDLIEAGRLPNLQAIAASGSYRTIATTRPAQTPVAWSTFGTGLNPGGHGIFDFLRRDPTTYLPDLGLNRFEQKNVFSAPKAVNLRRAPAVWEHLDRAGVPSVVIRHPCDFPPEKIRGRILSGMGVPDLRGSLGVSTFYTTRSGVNPGESETIVPLERPIEAGTSIKTHVIGPRSPKDQSDVTFGLKVEVDRPGRRIIIRSSGTPRELSVAEGEWSDWLQVKFKVGFAVQPRGLLRFHLIRVEPELEFYASPVNFDPFAPLFPIAHPTEYGFELTDEIGFFHTTGMVEDHNGLMNERLTEDAFLAQCDDAWREREAMLHRELKRLKDGFLYCLFDTTDRVQHLFWRFGEPDHPSNFGEPVDQRYAGVIHDQYIKADAIVGRVREHVDDQTLLLVLSDHGFGSFQYGFNLNGWLHRAGLLQLKTGMKPGPESGDLLKAVDWSKTKAYGLGLSGLYLNLQGREAEGTVKPEDAPGLRQQIAQALSGFQDPRNSNVAIQRALPREEAYSGLYLDEAPDVLIDFGAGYRISWTSSMGGVEADDLEPNTRKWSGDHIVAPELVPGVLFVNQQVNNDAPRLLDMAPTILEALGVPAPTELEGKSIL